MKYLFQYLDIGMLGNGLSDELFGNAYHLDRIS
jgi:hypothetical protein